MVITWDQDPMYCDYANRPGADLDLYIYDSSIFAIPITYSRSYDNTYEIVEFTPSV